MVADLPAVTTRDAVRYVIPWGHGSSLSLAPSPYRNAEDFNARGRAFLAVAPSWDSYIFRRVEAWLEDHPGAGITATEPSEIFALVDIVGADGARTTTQTPTTKYAQFIVGAGPRWDGESPLEEVTEGAVALRYLLNSAKCYCALCARYFPTYKGLGTPVEGGHAR